MNKWLLAGLRAKAEQIENVNLNMAGEGYKRLSDFIEQCNNDQLRMIIDSKIKWFSNMATSKLRERV